jgi:hypothetical protein
LCYLILKFPKTISQLEATQKLFLLLTTELPLFSASTHYGAAGSEPLIFKVFFILFVVSDAFLIFYIAGIRYN